MKKYLLLLLFLIPSIAFADSVSSTCDVSILVGPPEHSWFTLSTTSPPSTTLLLENDTATSSSVNFNVSTYIPASYVNSHLGGFPLRIYGAFQKYSDFSLISSWGSFMYNGQNDCSDVSIIGDTSKTHFTNIDLSTSTQTVRLRGYISPNDEDVHIGFNVSTPIYSQWDHNDLIATTTGVFDQSFIYQNFSTSTIDAFTFTGTLYSPSLNPFPISGEPSTPPSVYDTISTTTTANGIGLTVIAPPPQLDVLVAQSCNPFSSFWGISACITYLFFPDRNAIDNNVSALRDSFLTKAPIGYVTRLVTILNTTGTTTIPVLAYTWANDGGPLAGKTLSFDVDNYMVQAKGISDDMVSNTDHKTAWQIFQPFINMFLAIFVLYSMIQDVMGLKLIHNKR